MISVIIPALNESARIQYVVGLALRDPHVREVIVVDDGSLDDTPDLARAAGARVITSSLLGKGASMLDGLRAASHDLIVYLDGDLSGLRPDLISILTAPLRDNQADFVKARFTRSAGRVTVLTARPLLATFFPELAHFVQPLGGIIAARASLLRSLHFESDYGVDLGLLIDAHMAAARVAEVDIGHLDHDSQSLEALGDMSKQVVRTLLYRADKFGRLSGEQVREVDEVERHANAEFAIATQALGQVRQLAVFDMDGTLLQGRFVVALAEATGKQAQLARYLDHPSLGGDERSQAIAELFRGVPRSTFEQVAREIPLTPGAVDTVITLRKRGYTVGVVTDSYRIAAEIVRRRVFADFSVAHLLRFRAGHAAGELAVSPLFRHPQGCTVHPLCKQNVVLHLKDRFGIEGDRVLAVGDGLNDACMLRAAGFSFAFEPKSPLLHAAAAYTIAADLSALLPHLPALPQ